MKKINSYGQGVDIRVCYIYKIQSKNFLVKCINNTVFQKVFFLKIHLFQQLWPFMVFFSFQVKKQNQILTKHCKQWKNLFWFIIFLWKIFHLTQRKINFSLFLSLHFFNNRVTFSFVNLSTNSFFLHSTQFQMFHKN